jgi:hypothetical protein
MTAPKATALFAVPNAMAFFLIQPKLSNVAFAWPPEK